MKKISELLNAKSVPNPSVYERKTGTSSIRGVDWTPDAVHNVLISKTVIGQFTLTINEKNNVIAMAGEPLEIENANYAHLRAYTEMKLHKLLNTQV